MERNMPVNDCLLHFMAQLPTGRKTRRVWSDVVSIGVKLLCEVKPFSSPAASGHAATGPAAPTRCDALTTKTRLGVERLYRLRSRNPVN